MMTIIRVVGVFLLIAFVPILEFGWMWMYSYPFWLLFVGFAYRLWPKDNE